MGWGTRFGTVFIRYHLIACHVLALAAQETFTGRLNNTLEKSPTPRWRIETLAPATAGQRLRLPISFNRQDHIWVKEAFRAKGLPAVHFLALIERAGGDRFLLIDLDRDGEFSDSELRQITGPDLSWDWPQTAGPFRSFPVVFHLPPGNRQPDASRPLHVNDWTQASGTIDINGKTLKFAFEYDPAEAIEPRRRRIGVDMDGDGRVDFDSTSPESVFARDEDVVFRAQGLYVSASSVDLANLRFTVRLHPASEYSRIELTRGVSVPDFEFMDFQGGRRRLSEFRGRWVLLDFWGSWCPPCIADFPKLRSLYDRYRARGFEILGMTNDDNLESARKAVTEHGAVWPNATTSSVKALIEKRFRISAYPALALLDPEGRVAAAGEELEGAGLEQVLIRVFP